MATRKWPITCAHNEDPEGNLYFFLLIWRANLGRIDYWDLNKDAPEGMTILIIVVICQT